LELGDAKAFFAVFHGWLHALPWVNFGFAVLLCNQNIISLFFLHFTFSLGSLVLIVMLGHLVIP